VPGSITSLTVPLAASVNWPLTKLRRIIQAPHDW
jgi:hypothetical protein